MKTTANASSKATPRRCVLGVSLLLPFLMGGCPEFRDDLVGVFETATRGALLGSADQETIVNAARDSLFDASIDLFFDQFRSDG